MQSSLLSSIYDRAVFLTQLISRASLLEDDLQVLFRPLSECSIGWLSSDLSPLLLERLYLRSAVKMIGRDHDGAGLGGSDSQNPALMAKLSSHRSRATLRR